MHLIERLCHLNWVHFSGCYSQWDVVGDSLGLYKIFGLVLGDYMPADAIVDTVLQQYCSVYCVSLIQSYVTAVCLCHTANLQHKHDLTIEKAKEKQKKKKLEE